MRPTCAHTLSWSWNTAANALSRFQLPRDPINDLVCFVLNDDGRVWILRPALCQEFIYYFTRGFDGGSSVAAMPKRSSLTRGRSPGIDHSHAAAIPLAGQTAWQGLFRHGRLEAGQSFLIHGGSGGVGHFAIQFAKAKGAHVYTTVSTANVARRSLGADVVVDYKMQRFEDHVSNLDIVFDLIDGETR